MKKMMKTKIERGFILVLYLLKINLRFLKNEEEVLLLWFDEKKW